MPGEPRAGGSSGRVAAGRAARPAQPAPRRPPGWGSARPPAPGAQPAPVPSPVRRRAPVRPAAPGGRLRGAARSCARRRPPPPPASAGRAARRRCRPLRTARSGPARTARASARTPAGRAARRPPRRRDLQAPPPGRSAPRPVRAGQAGPGRRRCAVDRRSGRGTESRGGAPRPPGPGCRPGSPSTSWCLRPLDPGWADAIMRSSPSAALPPRQRLHRAVDWHQADPLVPVRRSDREQPTDQHAAF